MKKRKRRMRTGRGSARNRRIRRNRRLLALSGIVTAVALVFVTVLVVTLLKNVYTGDSGTESESFLETIEISRDTSKVGKHEYLNPDIINVITGSGMTVTEALSQRPETIELTPENTAEFASINNCAIVDDNKVQIEATSSGIPASDDKYYYLFEQATYEDGIAEGAEPLDRIYKGEEASFKLDLRKQTEGSRLFSKFMLAVKKDDGYVVISHPKYINNPEGCAKHSYGGMEHKSIKGILPHPLKLSELTDLGVNYCSYNIPLSHILTTSGGIEYEYGGTVYHFNSQIMNDYDNLFKKLNGMGIDIAAIILNDANPSTYPDITHPDARSGSTAPYYMFNATDKNGVRALAAIGSFLSARYSDTGHGNVSMWIIANEVNARKEYNYMAKTDVHTYTAAFTRAFRVFYNAIKS